MVGATANHNLLALNIATLLNLHLNDKNVAPCMSDMKVKIGTKYFYPDALVDCSNLGGQDCFIQSPTLIVKVLSKSTQQKDKTLKLTRIADKNLT